MNNVKGLTVTFEEPIKIEEARRIMDAIAEFRRVIRVDPVVMENASEYMDRVSIRRDIMKKIYEAIEQA